MPDTHILIKTMPLPLTAQLVPAAKSEAERGFLSLSLPLLPGPPYPPPSLPLT